MRDDSGNEIEFNGNTDPDSHVSNELGCSLYSNAVQITILDGGPDGICARVEFYGRMGKVFHVQRQLHTFSAPMQRFYQCINTQTVIC